jgi:hypothetical protein
MCSSFLVFGAQSRKIKQEGTRRRLITGKKRGIPPHEFMPFSEISRKQLKKSMLRMNWPILTP